MRGTLLKVSSDLKQACVYAFFLPIVFAYILAFKDGSVE
jgi:hypothetical protein